MIYIGMPVTASRPIAGWPVHTSVENSLDIIKSVLSNRKLMLLF